MIPVAVITQYGSAVKPPEATTKKAPAQHRRFKAQTSLEVSPIVMRGL